LKQSNECGLPAISAWRDTTPSLAELSLIVTLCCSSAFNGTRVAAIIRTQIGLIGFKAAIYTEMAIDVVIRRFHFLSHLAKAWFEKCHSGSAEKLPCPQVCASPQSGVNTSAQNHGSSDFEITNYNITKCPFPFRESPFLTSTSTISCQQLYFPQPITPTLGRSCLGRPDAPTPFNLLRWN